MRADLYGRDACGVLQRVLGRDLVRSALVGCHTHVLKDEGACATPTPHANPTSAGAVCYAHLQYATLLLLEIVIAESGWHNTILGSGHASRIVKHGDSFAAGAIRFKPLDRCM